MLQLFAVTTRISDLRQGERVADDDDVELNVLGCRLSY